MFAQMAEEKIAQPGMVYPSDSFRTFVIAQMTVSLANAHLEVDKARP